MTKQHPQRDNMLLAADNEYQMFDCDEWKDTYGYIEDVLKNPHYNWRPVKQTRTIKRWLWADRSGRISTELPAGIKLYLHPLESKQLSDDEINKICKILFFTNAVGY